MNNELQHHGVVGQKWGVRRYQNKDGSLTAVGKKRAQSKTAVARKKAYRKQTTQETAQKLKNKASETGMALKKKAIKGGKAAGQTAKKYAVKGGKAVGNAAKKQAHKKVQDVIKKLDPRIARQDMDLYGGNNNGQKQIQTYSKRGKLYIDTVQNGKVINRKKLSGRALSYDPGFFGSSSKKDKKD